MSPALTDLGSTPLFAGRKLRRIGPGIILTGRALDLAILTTAEERTSPVTPAQVEQDLVILAFLLITPMTELQIVDAAALGRDSFYRAHVVPWSFSDDPTADPAILAIVAGYLRDTNQDAESAAVKVVEKPKDDGSPQDPGPPPPPNS